MWDINGRPYSCTLIIQPAHEEKITKITKKRKGVRFQHAIQQCCYQTHVSVKYAKKNAGEGV